MYKVNGSQRGGRVAYVGYPPMDKIRLVFTQAAAPEIDMQGSLGLLNATQIQQETCYDEHKHLATTLEIALVPRYNDDFWIYARAYATLPCRICFDIEICKWRRY
jgi:hypothetical protein